MLASATRTRTKNAGRTKNQAPGAKDSRSTRIRPVSVKNLVDRHLEAGKERRGHDLPFHVSDGRPESFGVSAVDRHHILIRIDEPVLIDSRALVELPFEALVTGPGRR